MCAALHGRAELGLEAAEESRAYVQFLVPHSLESCLAAFLAKLEASSGQLGVVDVQMSLTSLEEVFLTIAKKVPPPPFCATAWQRADGQV